MNRVLFILIALAILSPTLRSQANFRRQLNDLTMLERQGRYDQAVRSLKLLMEANDLGEETGRALTMLGYAYEQQGFYRQAQKPFEQALQILKKDAPHSADYATALACFAELNNVTQGPEIAAELWSRALKVHKELEDHSGMAKDFAYLAVVELEKKHNRAAKKQLQQAIAQERQAKSHSDEQAIFLSDIQGWMASVEGDSKAEVAGYQESLDLRRKSQGENYPATGWAYLYLGVAYADCKDWDQAMANVNKGLEILDRIVGRDSPQYLGAQSLFAQVLDKKGVHDEASRIRNQVKTSMSTMLREQCANCTVSVASLR